MAACCMSNVVRKYNLSVKRVKKDIPSSKAWLAMLARTYIRCYQYAAELGINGVEVEHCPFIAALMERFHYRFFIPSPV